MTRRDTTDGEFLALQKTLYTSRNPTRRWLHCARRDWIMDAIRRHRPPSADGALEVGPGSGVYLPLLASTFGRVVASDIEMQFLEQASNLKGEFNNIDVVKDDIVASRLPSESFDLALCTEVIEHISDSSSAIRNIYRILKPGGVLILSTPQRYSTMEIACKVAFMPGVIDLVRKIYREPILETGHINLLTSGQAADQITDAGFSIMERHVGGLYLPVIAEALGNLGLHIENSMENLLKRLGMTFPLWTQYYVARRPRITPGRS